MDLSAGREARWRRGISYAHQRKPRRFGDGGAGATTNEPPQHSQSAADVNREECAARINALMGVTADDPARARRINIHNAAKTGTHCAKCAKELAPGEPVRRHRVGLGYGLSGWRSTVAPHWIECTHEWRALLLRAKPCEGCGRPVHNEFDGVSNWRLHTYRSEDCQRTARAANARQRRLQERGMRPCDECREIFEPARKDAKFCSVACKQKAYRHRVTDNKHRDGEIIKSSNVTDSNCRGGATFKSRNSVKVAP